jgi:sulfite reductase (ferredoxin)
MRALAGIATRYAGGNVRTTVEQNLVFRWVPQDKLLDLFSELQAIGLGEPARDRSSM